MNNEQKHEFSRVIDLEDAIFNEKLEILAEEEELKALAKRFGVHDINSLKLEYVITQKDDIPGAFILLCRLFSRVTKFIIEETGETSQIDEKFDVVLIDETTAKLNLDLLKDFDIEILEDNKFNIAEIAAQYLSLCIYM